MLPVNMHGPSAPLMFLDPRHCCLRHGTFALVSRNAMLRGLLSIEDGGKVLVSECSHGRSIFLWEDEVWDVHRGEQGVAPPLQPRPTRRVGRNFSAMHTFQFMW